MQIELAGVWLLLGMALASPLWQPPHLVHTSMGRNIRHLPCVSRRTGEAGTCMFAFSCAKLNGTHLGTCIDRFYFGSCCKVPEDVPGGEVDIAPPDDNSLDGSTTARIRPAITQKPPSSTVPPSSSTQYTSPSSTQAPSSTLGISSTTQRPPDSTTGFTGSTQGFFSSTSGSSQGLPSSTLGSTEGLTHSSPLSTWSPSTQGFTGTTPPTVGSTQQGPGSSSIPGFQNPTTAPPTFVTWTTIEEATGKPPPISIRPQVSESSGGTHKPILISSTEGATSPKPVATSTQALPVSSVRPSVSTSQRPPPSTAYPPVTQPSNVSSSTSPHPSTQPSRPTEGTHRPIQPVTSGRPPPSTLGVSTQQVPVSTVRPPVSPSSRPPPTSKPPQTSPTSRPPPQKPSTKPPPTPTRPPPSTARPPATSQKPQAQSPKPGSSPRPQVTSQKPKPTQKPPPKPTANKPKPKPKPTTKPPPTTRPTTRPTSPTTKPSSTTPTATSETWVPVSLSTLGPSTTPSTKPPTTKRPVESPSSPTTPESPGSSSTPFAGSTASVALSSVMSTSPTPPTSTPSFGLLNNFTNYKDVCGRRLFPESRVVGGDKSTFGKWPWQISLRQWRTSTYLHKCGAALLNENWAITAAHCVENVPPSDLLLRLGEHDLSIEDEPFGYQERRVQIVASHPQFDPRTFEYDLALLRFYEPVVFQPNIIPICVPEDDTHFVGSTAYVTGWGRLYEDGPLPSVLQEVSVPVINNTLCETMYRAAGYIEHIPEIFICAGWKKGGFDSCEGDSGGPMVIQRPDKRWLLAGVISWGIGCAEPNQPGVYTRISQFRHWINQILQF